MWLEGNGKKTFYLCNNVIIYKLINYRELNIYIWITGHPELT